MLIQCTLWKWFHWFMRECADRQSCKQNICLIWKQSKQLVGNNSPLQTKYYPFLCQICLIICSSHFELVWTQQLKVCTCTSKWFFSEGFVQIHFLLMRYFTSRQTNKDTPVIILLLQAIKQIYYFQSAEQFVQQTFVSAVLQH